MIEIGAAASDNSTIWGDLLVAAFGALVAAGLLWFVGYRLTFVWEDRKRRRESDLAAVATFYRLYGEFFAAWKLWDSHKRKGVLGKSAPHELQWELLEQVERAEGGYEALLVKLASERVLEDEDRVLLGCFREGSQMLREQIRRIRLWSGGRLTCRSGARRLQAVPGVQGAGRVHRAEVGGGASETRHAGVQDDRAGQTPRESRRDRSAAADHRRLQRRYTWWTEAAERLGLDGKPAPGEAPNRV